MTMHFTGFAKAKQSKVLLDRPRQILSIFRGDITLPPPVPRYTLAEEDNDEEYVKLNWNDVAVYDMQGSEVEGPVRIRALRLYRNTGSLPIGLTTKGEFQGHIAPTDIDFQGIG